MNPYLNTPPQKSKYEAIIAYATVVSTGALIVSLFGTAAPIWLISLLCASALVGVGLLITKSVKRILARFRANSVAKARRYHLLRLLKTFQELANHERTDSIVSALGNLQNQQEGWIGSGIQNLSFAQLASVFVESLMQTVYDSGRRYTTFHFATRTLCEIARSFSWLYFVEVIGKLRQTNAPAIPDYHKQNIESARERFSTFLDDLDKFCKETNQALGASVFHFHFERPKRL